MNIEFSMTVPETLFRGNTIDLLCYVDIDLTLFKIRANIFDGQGSDSDLATANVVGGNDNQIEITDAINGEFVIHLTPELTEDYFIFSYIEIELEDVGGEKYTVHFGPLNFVDTPCNGKD